MRRGGSASLRCVRLWQRTAYGRRHFEAVDAAAYEFLWLNLTQTLGFSISSLAIAYYWMSHQEYFGDYVSTNKTHTFIELFYLLTIAGMPVNNHFISKFPTELAPRLAISSDIFSWACSRVRVGFMPPTAIASSIPTR